MRNRGRAPRSLPVATAIIDLYFDAVDSGGASPRRATTRVLKGRTGPPPRDSRDHRLQVRSRDRRVKPEGFAVRLYGPQALVIPRHMTAFVAAVDDLDSCKPLHVRDSIPAGHDEPQRISVLVRQRL